MRVRAVWLTLCLAPLASEASAEPFWPDHARFALKPRLHMAIRPAPLAPPQRQARIYAIELARSPSDPPDLRVALQRRRQHFAPLRAAGPVLLPGADIQPRSSVMLADAQFDLPTRGLLPDDRLTATLGWQGAKFSKRAVNATSPFTRDDLRVRDGFLPSARLALAATSRLDLAVDYRETIQAYADSGTIGALGLDLPSYRALRGTLRPERDRRSRIGLRWAAGPDLQLAIDGYDGQVRDRLSFIDKSYLPQNRGSAQVRGVAVEATHSLSPALRWRLRYDRASFQTDRGVQRREERVALQGLWIRGPWHCALSAARASSPFWAEPGDRLRVEGSIDYVPAAARAMRLGLHLTDPDRLSATRLSGQPLSAPARAADQARTLMLSASLRW